jgi:lysophospholipase L1-like esterase
VAADFQKFVAKIHTSLPKTQIVVLSIRPSIAREAVWDVVKATNEKLAAISAKDGQLQFVDLTDLLLTPDGKPARDLLGDDLHHLNEEGFTLVSQAVKRAIQQSEGRYWRGYNGPPGQ